MHLFSRQLDRNSFQQAVREAATICLDIRDRLQKAQVEECVYSVSLFSCMVVLFPTLCDIHCRPTSMARYSLFELKVPLNNKP